MSLSRRAMLRGAGGIAVALPFLEALGPRSARGAPPAPPVRRFVALYHPNGVFTPTWFPTAGADEASFTLSPILAPLEPYRSHLLVTGGIDMAVAVSGPGEQHQRGVGAFLTGAKIDRGTFVGNDGSTAGYALGQSIDQALVPVLGEGTPIGSLQLGIHTLLANVAGVVSYRGAGQPMLPQNDPRLTFRTLFLESSVPEGALDGIALRRRSVLDAVQGQLQAMRTRVSRSDRQRLDEHLTLVRDLERRVTSLPPGACLRPAEPSVAYEREAEIGTVTRLQLELLVLAFRCDLTRVATVMLSDAMNHITMPHLDIRSDVHNLTHYSDGDPVRAQVGVRDTWLSGVLAGFLGELQKIDDPAGGTALDHTLVLWGSDVSRGNVHSHDDMPFVLAGGGAGFRMGRYVRWNRPSHNDLLVSILQAMGRPTTTFGDPAFCTGPLGNLT